MTTTTIEDEVLTLTAVMAPGKLCSGHKGEIPGGCAYEDQDGWLWCLECSKHLATCTDEDCEHPHAVFAQEAPAGDSGTPDPKVPHPFELDPDQPPYGSSVGGYCRCGWQRDARVHQVDQPKAA